MAKLRKWAAYRKVERPYTRWSRVRSKAFVKSRPGKKIIKYDMGDLKGGMNQFPIRLRMVSLDLAQVRTNALEAARTAALKRLEKKFGRLGFYFQIRTVPHQAIRENPLAAGAGADRLSTGMKHAFGKIIGTAAHVEKGKVIMEIAVSDGNELFGREVLNVAAKKLPVRVTIQGEYIKPKTLSAEEQLAKQERFEKAAKQDAAQREKEAAEKEAATAKKAAAPAKK